MARKVKEDFLRYTVILTGDLIASFADKDDALEFGRLKKEKTPRTTAFVEVFDTDGGGLLRLACFA